MTTTKTAAVPAAWIGPHDPIVVDGVRRFVSHVSGGVESLGDLGTDRCHQLVVHLVGGGELPVRDSDPVEREATGRF